MMHAVTTHVKPVYNILGSLFLGKTIVKASPKGKQAGESSGKQNLLCCSYLTFTTYYTSVNNSRNRNSTYLAEEQQAFLHK